MPVHRRLRPVRDDSSSADARPPPPISRYAGHALSFEKPHRLSSTADPPLTSRLVQRVRHHRRFHRLGIDDSAIERAAAGAGTYGEFLSNLFTEVAKAKGKPLVGHKRPTYVRHMMVLDRLFPWTRFLHIVRDGRDVALSILDWARPESGKARGPGLFALWDEEPVAACALWWESLVTQGRRDGAILGSGRYLEVHYDPLVERPEEMLGAVLSFLGLHFSEEAMHFYVERFEPQLRDRADSGSVPPGSRPGDWAKRAWLPPTPGLRDWRAQMAPRDIELFEAIAGDLLEDLGYERAYPRVSAAVADVAERCRFWWATNGPKPSTSGLHRSAESRTAGAVRSRPGS